MALLAFDTSILNVHRFMKSTSSKKKHTLTVAVIGASHISEEHLTFLRDCHKVHLFSVCHLSLEKARIEDETDIDCGHSLV